MGLSSESNGASGIRTGVGAATSGLSKLCPYCSPTFPGSPQDDLALLRVDLVHRHRQLRIVRVRDEQDVQPVRADVALVVADVALRRKARIRYRVGQLCRIGRVEESEIGRASCRKRV